MPRAFSISSESIAKERERVGGDLDAFDISRVIQLDEAVLREMGPDDVHLRILAVSAEHNVDHAALADTVIALGLLQLRRRRITLPVSPRRTARIT